ncbi:hypothetical protein ACFQE8_24410 [Salinirubellus sp. GCM10025818]|uniref:hypothetical protein n=1 Tax=Salinirubellus sp. GCM10025899 TaxID=3252689 RepID=UPI003621C744
MFVRVDVTPTGLTDVARWGDRPIVVQRRPVVDERPVLPNVTDGRSGIDDPERFLEGEL